MSQFDSNGTPPTLDTIGNAMATPRQSNRGAMRAHVLGKMSQDSGGYSSPGGAITETSGGRYRVNDLNPSNGIQNFGTSASKGEALKHLRAIEYFKHHGG